jgi:hypothetical protein
MANAKRSFKQNQYGNVAGYEGRNRVAEFGDECDAEDIAQIWVDNPQFDVAQARDEYLARKWAK